MSTNQFITDAEYAVKNPDVLHTPHQYRQIISGLLGTIEGLEVSLELAEMRVESAEKDVRLLRRELADEIRESMSLKQSRVSGSFTRLARDMADVQYRRATVMPQPLVLKLSPKEKADFLRSIKSLTTPFSASLAADVARIQLAEFIDGLVTHHKKQIAAGFERSRRRVSFLRHLNASDVLPMSMHYARKNAQGAREKLKDFPPAYEKPAINLNASTEALITAFKGLGKSQLEAAAAMSGFARQDKLPREYPDLIYRLHQFFINAARKLSLDKGADHV